MKQKKKNICFFVESFSDMPNINGICVKNIADELIQRGHTVTVFTCFTEIGQQPVSYIDGIKVYRIHRTISSDLMNVLKKHPSAPLQAITTLLMKVNAFIHYIVMNKWPLLSYQTVTKYVHKAKAIFDESLKPDVCVGVYFHIEEVLSALKMKKLYPDCKTIVYLLDAMGGRDNPIFFKNSKFHFNTKDSIVRWEKNVLSQTDWCLAMNAHKKYFEKEYGDMIDKKILFTDIPLMKVSKENMEYTMENNPPKMYKAVYTGFSSKQTGSAVYFIDMLNHMENIEFHMYGRTDETVRNAIESSPLYNNRLFYHGYVDNLICKQVQMEADVLVTFGSVNRCMISGKIFEYMSTGKSILCLYQIDDDSNIEYLKQYPSACIIKENYAELELNVKIFSCFLETEYACISSGELKQLFRYNLPETTAEMFVKAEEKLV